MVRFLILISKPNVTCRAPVENGAAAEMAAATDAVVVVVAVAAVEIPGKLTTPAEIALARPSASCTAVSEIVC